MMLPAELSDFQSMIKALQDAEVDFVILRLQEHDFEVVHANEAFVQRTGRTPSPERPLPGSAFYPDEHQRAALAACLQEERRCRMELTTDLRGELRHMTVNYFPLRPPYFAGLVREPSRELRLAQVFRSLERVKKALHKNPEEFYAAALAAALDAVPGADSGSLWILEGDRFTCTAQVGHGNELLGFSTPFEAELRWYGQGEAALRQGVPRVIGRETIQARNEGCEIGALESVQPIQANLLIPIARDGEVFATFNLDSHQREDAFTQDAIEAGQIFAEEILAFLETERREVRLRERLALLESIVEINRIARRARNQAKLYQETLRALKERMDASQVSILLLEEGGEHLRVVASTTPEFGAGTRVPRGEGASWEAIEEKRLVRVPDIYEDPRVHLFGQRQGGPVELLAAPLINASGAAVGVITANSRAHRRFGDGAVAFFEATAEAIGLATERLQAIGEITRRAESYRKLIVLSTEVEVMEDPNEIAERALRTVLQLTPFEAGVFYTLNDDRVVPEVITGNHPPEFPHIYVTSGIRLGEGLVGSAIAERRGGAVHDYSEYPGALRPFVEIGVRSILIEPLWVKDVPYGGLALLTFGQSVVASAEARYLIQLTARRIERAFERVGHLATLKEAREAMLRAFGVALERRDYETKGHTERVADLSTRLARALGLRGADLVAVRWGAYLHDIGKLAIPDRILLKEGPLDEVEWELMRKHTEIGYEMLEPIPFLPDLTRNIVRYHHERWDGSGYPAALAGTDIPLEARIFAVVDVYDALAHDRPYKKGWSRREASEELRRIAGKHLDPLIVDRFLQVRRGLRHG